MITLLDNVISEDEYGIPIRFNTSGNDNYDYSDMFSPEFLELYVGRVCNKPLDIPEKQLHFAMLDIVDDWEIKATGIAGGIFDLGKKKADVYFYPPVINRIVMRVDWLKSENRIIKSDIYSPKGYVYASRYPGNRDGETLISYTYKEEMFVHNLSNGRVIEYSQSHCSKISHSSEIFVSECIEKISREENVKLVTKRPEVWDSLLKGAKNVSICC